MSRKTSHLTGEKVVEGQEFPSSIPRYREGQITFRFADDLAFPRFHLEGIEAGRRVAVNRIDPDSGERLAYWRRPASETAGW